MSQPLVSPARLQSFQGLVQHKVLLLWGAIEVLAPDIAAFAGRMRGDGVDLQVHVETNEPHVYPLLPFDGVRQKGAKVIVPFLASCTLNKA
jgi:acetyl esterase/lipase